MNQSELTRAGYIQAKVIGTIGSISRIARTYCGLPIKEEEVACLFKNLDCIQDYFNITSKILEMQPLQEIPSALITLKKLSKIFHDLHEKHPQMLYVSEQVDVLIKITEEETLEK